MARLISQIANITISYLTKNNDDIDGNFILNEDALAALEATVEELIADSYPNAVVEVSNQEEE